MNKEKMVFTALKPLDMLLGAGVTALKSTGKLEDASASAYQLAHVALSALYTKNNDLVSEGLHNVPTEGGFIIAPNHQSWNDVQVIGASSPRRVRFLAKTEFKEWPVLRQLIALTDSPYIARGGDTNGMQDAINSLKDGKGLAIFPEGTIPGEEDIGRHEVQRKTGLLRGHSGAVRMAIAAKIPIIPVGISGTGQSFPPEIYPRLETLEPPKNNPVTVRYGEPIYFDEYYDKEVDRKTIRKLTDKMMVSISKLIDHEENYIPITVPIKPLTKYEKVGVLLLHGFTGSTRTVEGMIPHLEAAGIPFAMPVLRGHGTVYTDMEGVTSQDWYDDAETALLELSTKVDKVIVVGLSMGGLVAINLGIRHSDKIAGLVTWAAALRFKDPLAPVAPALSKYIKSWPSPTAFNDKSLASTSSNYPKFMTSAFGSLLSFAQETEARLEQLEVPIAVLQSKKDQVVAPIAANIIYRDASSTHREIHWFEKSGHEMGQDLEAKKVFETSMDFVNKFIKKN
ncbi:alpha/beta fold hydrolase [Myxococcota bacterium]|nr:alpha/beta fold hydrolase [Myxococcota bacterium]